MARRTDRIEYQEHWERLDYWRINLVSKPVAQHDNTNMFSTRAFCDNWSGRTVLYMFLSIPYKTPIPHSECRLLPRIEGSRTVV